ncbi:LLM class flavin-dependent oxidoreductase [Roseovarius pelagicus]|uniref:LLM class flavin-dependent oxidoreductase n=1 Tax=Roseovarius pelagicus TaxID=2980108 RepID=A0ABY6D5W3_9RHOB|nr:LLM class flavin-dependent oxidoreductase [Roseovarius pelagicus]UXX81532.1 LLM class flavin-dependent oxidoreductase [Roseovarius pelagicus]
MEFDLHFTMDYHDKSHGGDRIYKDMVDQAILADKLGYKSVSVTEHHLLEIGVMPAPLTAAVKIAAHTKNLEIITGVVVLPLHDMRIYAGEVIVADIFCEGRLILGVGRGAYKFEMERLDVPMDEARERFDESLNILQALLSEEEVSWDGKYYKFAPLTVMPRPVTPGGPPMLMAVLNPEAIYHCSKRGFNILTTPLAGDKIHFKAQVDAFNRGKQELEEQGDKLQLIVSRSGHIATSEAQKQKKLEQAHHHFSRFDNIFTGPVIVDAGTVRSLPRTQTIEELEQNLLICPPQEMVDRLGQFLDLGIDRISLNMNFGPSQEETMETIQCIVEEVMPHFSISQKSATSAEA